jgi:DNA-binding transcriptional regulator WhiA
LKNKKLTAYIIGIAIGDGNLSNSNGRAVRLRITCDNKYPKLKNYIKESLKIILPKNKVLEIKRKGCVDVCIYSNTLEELLGWKAKSGPKSKQNISIPEWIIKNKTYLKQCVLGLIQTDGSIYKDRDYLMINFTTIIKGLADDFHTSLERFGYKPQTRKVTNLGKTKYIVRLSKNVDRFIKEFKIWKE